MADKITLGSGKLYVVEYTNTIPADSVIETNANLIGYIQGGATITYSPEFYTAEDDLGYVAKKIITNEEVVLSSGVMTWNGETLAKLSSTATVSEDNQNDIRTVKIGGAGNFDGKKYVIHFLHEDPADGDVRITMIGSNDNGFELSFAKDKETVINAEFRAMPCDANGTLLIYKEDME